MQPISREHLILDNFEGSIEFLLHLIQSDEICIHDIPLHKLTRQFLEKYREAPELDSGAEFVGTTAFLVWLKSKALLPQHEQAASEEEREGDPRFNLVHQLLDYCRFKEAAKVLEEREVDQSAYYLRGHEDSEVKRSLGIEHISLEDLAVLFKEILAKAQVAKGSIAEEEWKVSDKMEALKTLLDQFHRVAFEELFSSCKSKLEMIVTFLALLEWMKRGEVRVVRRENQLMVEEYAGS